MFTILGLKYGLMTFAAIVGVIQAAAAYNGLRGLLFFPNKVLSYIFAALAVTGPLVIFFIWNYLYPINVVAGSQQAGLFFFATIAAILFTVVVSGLINIRFHTPGAASATGLDALRRSSWFHILRERFGGKH